MQQDEMNLINQYSRKELSREEVYIFSITLCDNDIDRDFERFTKQSLDGLCELFKGKTGIFDHNMKSMGQSARIFETWTENVPGKKTIDGEDYYRLRAKAYMVRTESNKALIDEIEGGIKKEVSVGCSMGKTICSICGSEMRTHECTHTKGKTYDGKLCYGILSEPNDAYEWSFVAVPSQRQAGVTKSFVQADKGAAVQTVKAAQGDVFLSHAQASLLAQYIGELEKSKKEAESFRSAIFDEIKKYALIALPYVDCKSFLSGFEAMDASQLCALRDGLKKQVCEKEVPVSQLSKTPNKESVNNSAFKI